MDELGSHVFSEQDLAEAAVLLGQVLEAFDEEADGTPSLGELLEILGSSVPTGNSLMGDTPFPLTLRAKVGGTRWYKPKASDRVDDLNDTTFNEAAELLGFLVERAGAATGKESSPADLADYIHQLLRSAAVPLADVDSAAVSTVGVVAPKRLKAAVGDVVAIPLKDSGYRLAVLLNQARGEIAIGLLAGEFPEAQLGDVQQHRPAYIPIISDGDRIADKTWPIIDHREELLDLFPEPAVKYLRPLDNSDRHGKFGAAFDHFPVEGKAKFRLVGKAEAEAFGLLDPMEAPTTYRQSVGSDYLPTLLSTGHFDNGPVPGFWH
ncbi:immunity 26/phosphotriesterase HocA family protein [Kribbella sp. NBC_01505]|uniref:hypothetical protein n=1 Tax=Kribbella sp. NBC_01505 TaxID=2903580 RepID=UPI0038636643